MSDRHIRRTGNDYAKALYALLPQGMAWPREPTSLLYKVVHALSQIWGTVDRRAAELLETESDPRVSMELLPEWERAFGLPDKCLAEPIDLYTRRRALMLRITMLGQQSREWFIWLAAYAGYTITISEYRPFIVGIDRVGDNRTIGDGSGTQKDQFLNPLYDTRAKPVTLGQYSEYPYMLGPPDNRFYWTVHIDQTRLTWFRASSGQAGVDPHLRIALATDLECMLRRYKPAHTELILDYSALAALTGFNGYGSLKVNATTNTPNAIFQGAGALGVDATVVVPFATFPGVGSLKVNASVSPFLSARFSGAGSFKARATVYDV
jgi:uncharacterized protein YmfQ (DUF2313 family)